MGHGEVRVGTSGWAYREWVGRFYPEPTPSAAMLGRYGERLATVEAHSTYRRLPTARTVERWTADVPESFRFAPKAHVGITHRRDLDGVEERVSAFFAAVLPLRARLGLTLFQLPHRHVDLDRLDRLLSAVPDGVHVAFELHPAWLDDGRVVERLRAHRGATIALVDDDRNAGPDLDIGTVAYARLRRSRYSPEDLKAWAARAVAWWAEGRDVYLYLKHDDDARGPAYALELAELISAGGRA